jgi:hypothetical protein
MISMTVLDQYFELSDRAIADEKALQELIGLFSDQAEIRPAGASRVQGKEAIAQLYQMFFAANDQIQRVWNTHHTENGLEAIWAAAGRRDNGELFAMQGIHVAELDQSGKICSLEVRVAGS